jgi:NAD-dependent deacetylase
MIEQARNLVRGALRLAVLTGAGVSAESGIPVFRGPGGLWRQYRPEDLATPEAFNRDPSLVWEWYDWRRAVIAGAEPNAAHYALARLEQQAPSFTLITQNVDGLHDRAGSRSPLKLHGDIWAVRCLACRREFHDDRVPLPELPPRCVCGGLLRPGVVWFGESLPQDIWAAAERAAATADVLIVAGTSALVHPAAGLIGISRRGGASIIEVNIADTPYSGDVDFPLRGTSAGTLPLLLD